ncbi:MAG: hypothetical protein WC461_02145 [Candidatus Paceibacterota bacterium]
MDKKGRLIREVTTQECPWLGANLKKGKIVYRFNGCTYGCIGSGIAVSDKPGKNPFYEIPRDAVEWDV